MSFDNQAKITYRFEEEKAFLLFYAARLDDNRVADILNQGFVRNSEEAELLARFFWKMVDKSIEDEEQNVDLPWPEGAEFWSEKAMQTISGHLDQAGYEAIWESVSDEQD